MPAPQVVRPPAEFFSSERFRELEQFLKDHWDRAKTAREEQVDHQHATWQKNYEAIPAQKRRDTPWPGASNFVVPLIRMYIDTFVARTLNIIFATRPLFTLDFMPSEVRDSTAMYVNRKALHDWQMYDVARKLMTRGAKNGTTITKTIYEVVDEIYVAAEGEERNITKYEGARIETVPFDDFFVYPITAEDLAHVSIKFHRTRYVEEEAMAMLDKWQVDEDFIRQGLEMPMDVKRGQEQEDAGLYDPWLKELQIIECHLKFELEVGTGRRHSIIALLEPKSGTLVDVYYHPYINNMELFHEYKPLPREDMFWGESWAQILMQAQEEASTIHNDRRNNSYIANAPIFKRRSGSLLPNPSTNWYPGKVWDLDDMADFEVVMVGRNYNDMLAEENHIFMLAERIIGIGAVQQGNASGMMGKRGIYNAAGTMAVLSESNQRQDTNIRDVRHVLGAIGRTAFTMQSVYGADDPVIEMYPQKVADEIRAGLAANSPERLARSYFEIKASDAGTNKDAHKANLLQMASIIGQYGQMLPQMTTAILSTQNPVLQQILVETSELHRHMARMLLRSFDEYDTAELLPDITEAMERGRSQAPDGGGAAPLGGGGGGAGVRQPGGGGAAGAGGPRALLETVSALPRPA